MTKKQDMEEYFEFIDGLPERDKTIGMKIIWRLKSHFGIERDEAEKILEDWKNKS